MSTLYLRAARVVTGVDNGVIEDAAVQVEDGRIVSRRPGSRRCRRRPTRRSHRWTTGMQHCSPA